MTVPSTSRRAGPFTGTGILTSYPFTFKVFEKADVQVTIADTNGLETVLVTDSTVLVTLNIDQDATPGGSVQYAVGGVATALPAGFMLAITGEGLVFDQPAELPQGGNFDPGVIEAALDRLEMQIQLIRESVTRALQVGVTTSTDFDVALPSPVPLTLLGWSADGLSLVNYSPDVDSAAGLQTRLANTASQVDGVSMVAYNPALAYGSGLGQFLNRIYARTADEVAAGVTPSNYSFVPGDIRRYGADPTGSASSTAAVNAAIASTSAAHGGTVWFPPGVYKIDASIIVNRNRVHLVGAGSWATQILFAPTANDTCIELTNGAAVLFQGSVRGMTLYSNDPTFTKIGIDVVDTSGYLLDDIVIGGSVVVSGSTFWSGGTGSIGIRYRGREFCVTNRLYCYADKPIKISDNPNFSIDIDHFLFHNTYLGANGNPCVEVDSGVNLTNVFFTGVNPWVLGTAGFRWVDTTTVGASQTLSFKGVRFEQGTDSTAWCIQIEHNSTLQSLHIEGCQGGLERNGYRLRKVRFVTIKDNINPATNAARTVLDVDATVRHMTLENCAWGGGSAVASMVAQRALWSYPKLATADPLPPTAVYDSTSNANRQVTSEGAMGGYEITLANNATAILGSNTMAGRLTVVDSEYLTGSFDIRGTNNQVAEAPADTAGVFSNTAGTVGSTNVYPNAGNYEIENKRGATRRYKIFLVGTYTNF